MPSVSSIHSFNGGGEMKEMADGSLALSVAEATMQDWMAAVTQARLGLPPLPAELRAAPVFDPHPIAARPAARRVVRRPATQSLRESGSVAGARSAYWIALAAVLAWVVLL